MDDEPKIGWVARIGMFLTLLFLVSMFQSCDALRYRLSGKETQAKVSNVCENRDRWGRVTGYTVSYGFLNENTRERANGHVIIGEDDLDKYFAEQTLQIEYFGNDWPTSRIKGTGSVFWPVFFIVSVIAMVGCAGVLTLQWSQQSGSSRGRRRR